MSNPIFLDTETVGYHGVPVLIQWCEGDGDIELWSPWTNPISDTLQLIEKFCSHEDGLIFFNAVFDWFMLAKIYTIFSAYKDYRAIPQDIINDLADLEMEARDGPCIKPVKCHDVFLHARKTQYQSTMERSDIRIKKVPTKLAWLLASELENRIKLKDIYFARRKKKNVEKWKIYDIKDFDGQINPDFKDIVLKFSASSALKALAADALNLPKDDILLFGDINVDSAWTPKEIGYAPFAKALGGDRTNWKGAWPEVIQQHIDHWLYNERARRYAGKDVEYTRSLYKYFGSPKLGDDDSELACAVAAMRWCGFKIDTPRLKELKEKCLKRIKTIPMAPKQVRYYVSELLDEAEKLVIKRSTKKTLLEEITRLQIECPRCHDIQQVLEPDCNTCKGRGLIRHPAADRAQEVLDARASKKEIEVYDKLLIAGRFHISNEIIGALSGRMSGRGAKLNSQGIKKTKEVRECFPLSWPGMQLDAGDYEGFEVTLAEARYEDKNLRKDLLTCERCEGAMVRVNDRVKMTDFLDSKAQTEYMYWRPIEEKEKVEKELKKGKSYSPKTAEEIWEESFENDFICTKCGSNQGKKIHALFGMNVYPGMTYEQIKATSGTKDDIYTRCKSAVFAMIYGGEGFTLKTRLGVNIDDANKAFALFEEKYPGVGVARRRIKNDFQSMRQEGGIGTKVEWHEPKDYVESMLGFRRYFTLENKICKALFDLANNPPKSWQNINIRVVRRDRVQTGYGAVQSALYAAAFNIQSSSTRQALNHEIQSTGGQITKTTQRNIWDLQPSGINKWRVMPANFHDEIQVPCLPEISNRVKEVVKETVESFRSLIPLIKIDWQQNLKSWASK